MKSRIIALCWFFYIIGIVTATKGLEPRLKYEVMTVFDKLQFISVVAATMFISFEAGKEQMRGKK